MSRFHHTRRASAERSCNVFVSIAKKELLAWRCTRTCEQIPLSEESVPAEIKLNMFKNVLYVCQLGGAMPRVGAVRRALIAQR